MTFEELSDAVMNKLKENSTLIGVETDSIIEGGREAIAPSINVFISPDIFLEENKSPANIPGFIKCKIELVCLVNSYSNDDESRRKAYRLCLDASTILLEMPGISEMLSIEFAQVNSDASACVSTLSSIVELL